MRSSQLEIKERRDQIYNLITENKYICVKELCLALNVSPATIRRDLQYLKNQGLVSYSYGHLEATNFNPTDISVTTKLLNHREKIAQLASRLIANNQTIVANSSSLAWQTINHLATKKLDIISNNVDILTCAYHQKTNIILTGGEVSFSRKALTGTSTINFLSDLSADLCIIGSYGVTNEGLTSPFLNEAIINRKMIDITTGPVICVADYRKIGVESNFKICDMTKIDYLVTDIFADPILLKKIENIGVNVVISQ